MKVLIFVALLVAVAAAQRAPQRPQRPVGPNFPQQNKEQWIEHPDYLDCPEFDHPKQVVFYPYHLNCANFYQCVKGRAVLLLCPAGQLWDRDMNFCDSYDKIVYHYDMC